MPSSKAHQQVTSLGQTAEEYECLWCREGCKVSAGLTQHLTSEVVDALSQGIALAGSHTHVVRSDILWLHLAEQRRLVACLQELACCASYTRSRAVSLQTTSSAATAYAASLAITTIT